MRYVWAGWAWTVACSECGALLPGERASAATSFGVVCMPCWQMLQEKRKRGAGETGGGEGEA